MKIKDPGMKDNSSPPVNPLSTVPVTRLIAQFSIPAIINTLIIAVYNITDQIFIGNVVGMLGNAATNVCAFIPETLLLPLLLILPLLYGIEGAILAGPIADALAVIVSISFITRELKAMKRLNGKDFVEA